MKNVLVGFYQVEGYGLDSVETPIVGNPTEEHARLNTLIRKRHPKAKSASRTGTVIENRDGENAGGYVEFSEGTTIGQLFSAEDTPRKAGQCWFSGSPYNIVLMVHRAQGAVTIVLRARLNSDGDIRLPDKISPQRLASELPKIVEGILGKEARDIKLNLREAKS